MILHEIERKIERNKEAVTEKKIKWDRDTERNSKRYGEIQKELGIKKEIEVHKVI